MRPFYLAFLFALKLMLLVQSHDLLVLSIPGCVHALARFNTKHKDALDISFHGISVKVLGDLDVVRLVAVMGTYDATFTVGASP